jgi:hypothetical protein
LAVALAICSEADAFVVRFAPLTFAVAVVCALLVGRWLL